jgi:hypothetical protein
MNLRDKGVIAAGAAVVALMFYVALTRTQAKISTPTNDTMYDKPFTGLNALSLVEGQQGDNHHGHWWRYPDYDMDYNTHAVKLPVRYPVKSGQNLTAIINRGWEPMMRPAPSDAAWMECPPSEVTL